MKQRYILSISILLFVSAFLIPLLSENISSMSYHTGILIITLLSAIIAFRTKQAKSDEIKTFFTIIGISMMFVFFAELLLIGCSIWFQKYEFVVPNLFILFSYGPIFYIVIKQIYDDFQVIKEQIIITVTIGFLLLLQYLPMLISFLRVIKNPSTNLAMYSWIETFLFVVFIAFDLTMFLLLFILFSIYSRNEQNQWLVLIISYLFLTISDGTFFFWITTGNKIGRYLYLCFNWLHLGSIFVGILMIKSQTLEFRTLEKIDRERIQYRNLLEEMDQLTKYIAVFTNILKQDLRNDITVIETALEMYSESGDKGFIEMANERIRTVKEKIFTMGMIEGFLDEEKVKPINLRIIHGVAAVFENVNVIYPEKEIFVKANRFLFSIFYGIIQNAIQHGGNKIRVEVEVNELKDCILVHIRDNGIGIPDNEKELIFHRDYSGRINKGGMNLFLIKITLDTIGGEIKLKDNYPQGTEVIIRLDKLYTSAL